MLASSKGIVICCDGTGNDYAGTDSNVLRLYRLVSKHAPPQTACYHPGIGTLPRPAGRTRVGRLLRRGNELFFGAGVIENVVELYAYLMHQYEPGDRLFLFGFSRGAFTVRALAGMVHVCGLLRREDEHLLAYAAGLYQTSEHRIKRALRSRGLRHFPPDRHDHAELDRDARFFKSLLSRPCPVAFMGIWDTVKAYGWTWPQSFPALRHNLSVKTVRHAVSLDERRAVFQMTGWGDRGDAVKEVWFAGDHSDVGGGHDEGNSALADATLAWMLGEATHAGLLLDCAKRSEVVGIVANGRQASSAEKRDLPREHWYWKCPLPRLDLDNSTYPPGRTPSVRPTGLRQPALHAESAPLRFHETVRARGDVDSSYRQERLLGRTRDRGNAAVRVLYEGDREITWGQ